jgi:hypothetical protein
VTISIGIRLCGIRHPQTIVAAIEYAVAVEIETREKRLHIVIQHPTIIVKVKPAGVKRIAGGSTDGTREDRNVNRVTHAITILIADIDAPCFYCKARERRTRPVLLVVASSFGLEVANENIRYAISRP